MKYLYLALIPLAVYFLPYHLLSLFIGDPRVSWDNCWKADKKACQSSEIVVKEAPLNFGKSAISDLKKRLAGRRQTDKIFVSGTHEGNKVDPEYGLSQWFLDEVLNYWEKDYDWSAAEAKMNSWNPKTALIEGLNIHFFHIKPKSSQKKVKPMLLLHGWPGSVWEFSKMIPKLQNPGKGDLAFDVVIPSLVGYGFSDAAEVPGMDMCQNGVVFLKLMKELYGDEEFVCQGGDWGSFVCQCIALLKPETLQGMHLNFFPFPTPVWSRLVLPHLQKNELKNIFVIPYALQQGVAPNTIGFALRDSPVSMASWVLEKMVVWSDPFSNLTMDDYATNLMIYWLTDSIASSVRLYKETGLGTKTKNLLPVTWNKINVKTGLAGFPREISNPPLNTAILKSKFPNLLHLDSMAVGGHYAALEQPDLLYNSIQHFLAKLNQ